jgi:hypothetical protein
MPIRDSAVSEAAYETQPEKHTMAGWFRGLWPGAKKQAPQQSQGSFTKTQTTNSANPGGLDQSSSIDPNRVYRGPQTDVNRGPSAGRGSRFSETGVPTSTSDCRGRQGSPY